MTPRTAVATLAVVAALFAALWFGIRGIGGEGGGEAPGPQVVSPHFGYNDYWPTLGVGPGADDDPFQLVADEGGDTIRYVVDWNAAQHYDEAGRLGAVAFPLAVTAAYERAVAHGIHPILVVVGAPLNERPNAPGAQPPVGTSCTKGSETAFQIVRDTPYALARWRAFVQSVANAYPEALGIEVWNEENYPPWWGGCLPAENGNHGPGTDPYVPHYVDVLKYAYDGVKGSRHPDIPIVMGGTATRGGDPNKLDWARFLTAVLKRTQSRYGSPLVDAVALHPYRNPEDPGTGPSLSQRFATSATDQVAEARGILRREGAGDIPIWVTEISASTSAPTHSLFAAASADATARRLQIDQADALDAIYVGLRDIGVPVIIVHSFADHLDRPGWQYGAGVTRPTRGIAPNLLTYPYRLKCAYYMLGAERGRQSVPGSCRPSKSAG